MSAIRPWGLGLAMGLSLFVALGCGGDPGEQRSFVSNKVEAVPTNVSGQGNTSGIGAGAALQAPGGTTGGGAGTPTVTPTTTVTPAPSK